MTATAPVIGSPAEYHGSITSAHGGGYVVLLDTAAPESEPRYLLVHSSGATLRQVRAASFTATPHEWPADAVPLTIGDHQYMGASAYPGGSGHARIVRFHTADGQLGRTWCHFADVTPEIRALDTRRL